MNKGDGNPLSYVVFDVNKTVMAADAAGGKSTFQGIIAAALENHLLDEQDFLNFINSKNIQAELGRLYQKELQLEVQATDFTLGNVYDNLRFFCQRFLIATGMSKEEAIAEQTIAMNRLLHLESDSLDLDYLSTIFSEKKFPDQLDKDTRECLKKLPEHGLIPSFLSFISESDSHHVFYTFGSDLGHLGKQMLAHTKGPIVFDQILILTPQLPNVEAASLADLEHYSTACAARKINTVPHAFAASHRSDGVDSTQTMDANTLQLVHKHLSANRCTAIQASYPVFADLDRNWRGGKMITVDPDLESIVTFFDDNIVLKGENIPGCVNIVNVKTGCSVEIGKSNTLYQTDTFRVVMVGNSLVGLKKASIITGLLHDDYFNETVKLTKLIFGLRKVERSIPIFPKADSTMLWGALKAPMQEILVSLRAVWSGNKTPENCLEEIRELGLQLSEEHSVKVAINNCADNSVSIGPHLDW